MILKQASEGALLGGRPPCENKLLGSGAVASAAAKTNLFKTRRGPGSALWTRAPARWARGRGILS